MDSVKRRSKDSPLSSLAGGKFSGFCLTNIFWLNPVNPLSHLRVEVTVCLYSLNNNKTLFTISIAIQ